jgi:hypothetical protein
MCWRQLASRLFLLPYVFTEEAKAACTRLDITMLLVRFPACMNAVYFTAKYTCCYLTTDHRAEKNKTFVKKSNNFSFI